MIYEDKMENIYRNELMDLVKELGSTKSSVTNYIVNALRRLKRKGKEVTPYNIHEDLRKRKKYWNNIEYMNENFVKVIEYYIFWEGLTTEQKNNIKSKRVDRGLRRDFKQINEYVYNNMINRLREQDVFLGEDVFKATLNAITSIENGSYNKEGAIRRGEKKYKVKKEDIEQAMDIVGYVELE